MALVFADSPDEFSAAQITRYYSAGSITGIGTPGPDGTGKYFDMSTDSSLPLPLTAAGEYMAIFDFFQSGSRTETWFQFQTAAGSPILTIGGGGTGGNFVINGTNYPGLLSGSWQHIQVRLLIGTGTSGHITVKADGTTLLDVATNTGSTNIGKAVWSGNNSGGRRFANLVILDASGSIGNSLPAGRLKVRPIYPTADGTYTDWAPDSGGNLYSRINEKPANDDTSYVFDQTVGHKFSCTMDHIPTSGIAHILGLIVTAVQKEDDAGGKTDQLLVRSGTTDHYNGADIPTVTGYGSTTKDGVPAMILITDPDTGVEWTPTGINAIECGAKITA